MHNIVHTAISISKVSAQNCAHNSVIQHRLYKHQYYAVLSVYTVLLSSTVCAHTSITKLQILIWPPSPTKEIWTALFLGGCLFVCSFGTLRFSRLPLTSKSKKTDQTRPDQTRPDQTRPDQKFFRTVWLWFPWFFFSFLNLYCNWYILFLLV